MKNTRAKQARNVGRCTWLFDFTMLGNIHTVQLSRNHVGSEWIVSRSVICVTSWLREMLKSCSSFCSDLVPDYPTWSPFWKSLLAPKSFYELPKVATGWGQKCSTSAPSGVEQVVLLLSPLETSSDVCVHERLLRIGDVSERRSLTKHGSRKIGWWCSQSVLLFFREPSLSPKALISYGGVYHHSDKTCQFRMPFLRAVVSLRLAVCL